MAVENQPATRSGRIRTVSEVLTDERRIRTLEALSEVPTSEVSLETLVDVVHAEECDEYGTADREAIETSLHHVHVPKLADAGIVVYDASERVVAHQTGRVADLIAATQKASSLLD